MSTDPPVRASDADREQVVAALRNAVGEGRLTLDEADERMTTAYAIRYRHELKPLTADLPAPAPPSPGLQRSGPPTQLFALLAVVLIVLWAVSPAPFFWPIIPFTFITLRIIAVSRHRSRHPGP
ncbi:MAG TPA: DUF1707 domain-containing protein [Pseudonocardiaceae bacterium]|jgi:hypothetical protein|nr:DUF1707 domain-containing protein [Pseudonocardiaceae bacterium]